MRQRAHVILDPCEIAGVKPAAPAASAEIALALVERRTADLLAHWKLRGPFWSDRLELSFLFVAERCLEVLERRAHQFDGLQHSLSTREREKLSELGRPYAGSNVHVFQHRRSFS